MSVSNNNNSEERLYIFKKKSYLFCFAKQKEKIGLVVNYVVTFTSYNFFAWSNKSLQGY